MAARSLYKQLSIRSQLVINFLLLFAFSVFAAWFKYWYFLEVIVNWTRVVADALFFAMLLMFLFNWEKIKLIFKGHGKEKLRRHEA